MEIEAILDRLRQTGSMPTEAIRAAADNRDAVVPALIAEIQRCVALDAEDEADAMFVFAAFHLLGSLRATEAYIPLAGILHLPAERLDWLLGDAVTETSHRVMAAVFDGDPAPLYALIEDREADESIRSRMCETLAMLARDGSLPRDDVALFLRGCFERLRPQSCNFVWQGWQSAIAMLDLDDLVPQVRQAFQRGYIDRTWMRFSDFQQDLAEWRAGPAAIGELRIAEFTPFGDIVEELAGWPAFSEPDEEDEGWLDAGDEEEPVPDWALAGTGVPAYNPYRHVSRNDPCPCGSGKKFKRCCMP